MRPDNIVKVSFGGLRTVVSAHRYQYDYGQVLLFNDLDLPESYEVHFSNEEYGTATVSLGDDSGVLIPDIYFTTGETVYAWLFLHNEADDGRTLYTVKVPVKKRAKPENVEPTPVEQSIIEQAITALNNAVDKTTASEYAAKESELLAKESEESARTSAESAGASSELAGQYASDASAASDEASRYAESARVYSEQANQNADVAQTAKTSAETAAGTAIQKASEASDSASTASTAAQTATAKANEASASATTASGAASTATQKAAEAAQKATEATEAKTAAENARDSAEAAQTASETAQAKAEEAATHLTIDPTLTQQGQAADAKKVGDEISDLKRDIADLDALSDDVKTALLNCFQHVAWTNSNGQSYYNALYIALYPRELVSISAVFDSQGTTIYTDDTLESLKQYLTVTASYSDQITVVVTDYTLSGTLVEGSSTLTITYSGKTTTVTITVVDWYEIYERSVSDGLMEFRQGGMSTNNTTPNKEPRAVDWTNNYPRYSTYVEKGKRGLWDDGNTELTDMYPIPVPSGATTAKVDITPNTQYFAMQNISYNATDDLYTRVADSGWKVSGTSVTLHPSTDFVTINLKYDSAGTSYPVVPTDVAITFE